MDSAWEEFRLYPRTKSADSGRMRLSIDSSANKLLFCVATFSFFCRSKSSRVIDPISPTAVESSKFGEAEVSNNDSASAEHGLRTPGLKASPSSASLEYSCSWPVGEARSITNFLICEDWFMPKPFFLCSTGFSGAGMVGRWAAALSILPALLLQLIIDSKKLLSGSLSSLISSISAIIWGIFFSFSTLSAWFDEDGGRLAADLFARLVALSTDIEIRPWSFLSVRRSRKGSTVSLSGVLLCSTWLADIVMAWATLIGGGLSDLQLLLESLSPACSWWQHFQQSWQTNIGGDIAPKDGSSLSLLRLLSPWKVGFVVCRCFEWRGNRSASLNRISCSDVFGRFRQCEHFNVSSSLWINLTSFAGLWVIDFISWSSDMVDFIIIDYPVVVAVL